MAIPYAGPVMKRLAPLFDVVSVVLFVAIGRSAHDHGDAWRGLISTSWPFLVGLVAGWLACASLRWDLSRTASGGLVTVVTVAVGMVLRVLFGQGTAVAFVVVALAFLGLFLVGWRLGVRRATRR